jgi:hypothetical protein
MDAYPANSYHLGAYSVPKSTPLTSMLDRTKMKLTLFALLALASSLQAHGDTYYGPISEAANAIQADMDANNINIPNNDQLAKLQADVARYIKAVKRLNQAFKDGTYQ